MDACMYMCTGLSIVYNPTADNLTDKHGRCKKKISDHFVNNLMEDGKLSYMCLCLCYLTTAFGFVMER